MSTMRPAASARQESNRACSSRSAGPVNESPAAAPRSPKPRVLARFPDVDAEKPVEEPVETFAGLDGRIINQKLGKRILIGIACLLMLAAVLPLAFRREGKKQDAGETAKSAPSWQPENPAPDASVAPAWTDAATQVGEAVRPRRQAAQESAPPTGHDDTDYVPHTSTFRATKPSPPQTTEPQEPATDVPEQPRQRFQEQGALANRGQSIVPPDEATLDGARRGQFDDADRAELARTPEYDRRYPTASSKSNQASEMPNAHSPVDGYRGGYQVAQPESRYHQDGSAGYQEPATSYQPHRNDSATAQWQHSAYRDTDGSRAEHRDYAPEPTTGNRSAYAAPPAGDYRNAPRAADYQSYQAPDYRSQHAADYRNAPQAADYQSYQAPDYRSQHAADYRNAPRAADYQSYQAPDYRPQHAADYRSQQATDSWTQSTGNYGCSSQACDYRSAPTTNNGSSPAAGTPSQPYYSNPNSPLPTPNSQSAPGYYDGTGTQTAPGQGLPYYQADRRSEPAAGYIPYNAQPSGAQFQGTIEQPPVPSQYDASGSRLY